MVIIKIGAHAIDAKRRQHAVHDVKSVSVFNAHFQNVVIRFSVLDENGEEAVAEHAASFQGFPLPEQVWQRHIIVKIYAEDQAWGFHKRFHQSQKNWSRATYLLNCHALSKESFYAQTRKARLI